MSRRSWGRQPGLCNCEAFPMVPQAHLPKMASGEIQGLNQDVTGRHRWVLRADSSEMLFHRDLRSVVQRECSLLTMSVFSKGCFAELCVQASEF